MCSNMGSASSARSGTANTTSNGAPALDRDLINRANAAGTFVDYGDAGVRQYNSIVSEINGMDMTMDEKKAAINQLHSLITKQLEAESKALSPYSMGVGPARFDKNKMIKAEDKAQNARDDVRIFVSELRNAQEKKILERKNKALKDAMLNALNTGALEFTINGTTWRRKSRRGKTFTADR